MPKIYEYVYNENIRTFQRFRLANTAHVRKRFAAKLFASDDECSICLGRLPRAQRRMILHCSHVFCRICLLQHIHAKGAEVMYDGKKTGDWAASCPLCRDSFYLNNE